MPNPNEMARIEEEREEYREKLLREMPWLPKLTLEHMVKSYPFSKKVMDRHGPPEGYDDKGGRNPKYGK